MASELKAKIISVAARLFRARGYSAIGVTDVCKEAGVSRAHFYRLFESKRDLGVETIRVFAADRAALVDRALRVELPIRGQIQRMFSMLHAEQVAAKQQTGSAPGSPFSMFAGETSGEDAAVLRAEIESAHAEWRRRLSTSLAEADSRGEIRLPDSSYAAEAIVAFAEGALALARITDDPRVVADLAPAAMSLMIDRKATGSWPLILLSTGSFQSTAG